ncbi:MAG: type II CAAX endopeptidase family protein [Eubacteriales bacterium]|nr:type II CAAX endopeptidase family protein [Eubacteriales bacterium]
MVKIKIKSLITLLAGFLILYLCQHFSFVIYSFGNVITVWNDLGYVALNIASELLLIYLYSFYILRLPFGEIYIKRPGPQKKWVLTAAVMSLAVLFSCIIFTEGSFVRETLTGEQIAEVLCYTVLSIGLRAAVTEEMIFRGLVLGQLKNAWGEKPAILISGIAFSLIHCTNVDTSSPSLVISVIAATLLPGILFALITLETGSIWSGAAFHGLYNIISGDGQILHVSTEQYSAALLKYVPVKEYRWITGIPGTDDIETGLPAMLGFACLIAWLLYRRKRLKGIKKYS